MGIIAHLTNEQLLSVVFGASDFAADEHLRHCVECRATLAELSRKGAHPTPGDLAAFVAADLDDRRRHEVSAHLRDCQFCQAAHLELTREPKPGATPSIRNRRVFTPAFFGIYIGAQGHEGELRFLSPGDRESFVAAAQQSFEKRAAPLSRLLSALTEFEDAFALHAKPSQFRLLERRVERFIPLEADQRAAEASIHELRDKAVAVKETLQRWEAAIQRWARDPLAFATDRVRFSLGAMIEFELRGTVRGEHPQVTLTAVWLSGTPGRNIVVRAISLNNGSTESGRTDASGEVELHLDRGRYKIELEHAVHGGGGFVLDLLLSLERTN